MAVPLIGAHGRKNSLRFSAAIFYYSAIKTISMAVPLIGAHGRKSSLRFSAAIFKEGKKYFAGIPTASCINTFLCFTIPLLISLVILNTYYYGRHIS